MLDSVRLGKLREATQAARQASKKGPAVSQSQEASDAVSMSSVAVQLNHLLQDMDAPVDPERVHDVQQAIGNGSYKIDFDFLAENLLNDTRL